MESSQVFSLSLLQGLAWENVNKTQDMNLDRTLPSLCTGLGIGGGLNLGCTPHRVSGSRLALPPVCRRPVTWERGVNEVTSGCGS